MEQILLLASPIVVSLITSIIKPVRNRFDSSSPMRKTVLRFLTIVFSFAGVVGAAIVSGQEVDMVSIQTFSDTVLVFLGATGTYFLAKRKSATD